MSDRLFKELIEAEGSRDVIVAYGWLKMILDGFNVDRFSCHVENRTWILSYTLEYLDRADNEKIIVALDYHQSDKNRLNALTDIAMKNELHWRENLKLLADRELLGKFSRIPVTLAGDINIDILRFIREFDIEPVDARLLPTIDKIIRMDDEIRDLCQITK